MCSIKSILVQFTGIIDWSETYVDVQDFHVLSSGSIMITVSSSTYGVYTPLGSTAGLSESKEDSVASVLSFLNDLYLSQNV